MWPDQTESTVALVQNTIHREVRRLIREHIQYGELELLAAAQSILFLLSILLFNDRSHITLTVPESAQLLIDVWEVKRKLASTGLFLDSEMYHQIPPWKSWALVSAKRRTIMSLHHIEYSWSSKHNYPTLECTEFKLLPAPAPRYLWCETDGHTWTQLYKRWLQLWDGDFYRMQELFDGVESRPLNERGELWLSEADEFGAAILSGGINYSAVDHDGPEHTVQHNRIFD
ncbi:hypothetical protein PISL3812_00940 [Talaromyces islandicus]|uniref:Uncharacterized protein n=1 Tax=Talaromyces islandicus TaxID=28573 RepID=A0A0U1LKN4_TALIS|nr:hypothetical protein PISL3812_00940 [Talaromyces islandicus]